MDELEMFGLLVKAVARESDRRLNEVLKPAGVTASQAEVLQLLHAYGPLSLGELGDLVLAEGGHPSRLVDRLVIAGLVERTSSREDRRRLELRCTTEGARLAVEATEAKERFRAWLRSQLGLMDLQSAFACLAAVLQDTDGAATVNRRQGMPLALGQPSVDEPRGQ